MRAKQVEFSKSKKAPLKEVKLPPIEVITVTKTNVGLAVYSAAVTLLSLGLLAMFLRQTVETVAATSALRQLQKVHEALSRTAGISANPGYVCYSKANKQKLEKLLGE